MTVSLLHPEDLLEKAAHGRLTDAERVRLEAHLAECPTCRFEHLVRADFAEELEGESELSTQRLLAIIEGIPAPPSLAPPAMPTAPSTAPARKRARRTATFAMLVAAALFVGSVATAAGAWERISATFAGPSEIEEKLPTPPAPPEKAPALGDRVHLGSPRPAPADSAEAAIDQGGQRDQRGEEESPAGSSFQVSYSPPTHPPGPDTRGADTRGADTRGADTRVDVGRRRGAPTLGGAQSQGGGAAAALFEQASEARNRGDIARAIALHQQLQTTYPGSREAHASYATAGRLLLDRGDAMGALADFDAYRRRGAGPLDEVVLVGRATALERLGRTSDAQDAWRTLLDELPSTPYAGHARARLEPHDVGSRGDRAPPR